MPDHHVFQNPVKLKIPEATNGIAMYGFSEDKKPIVAIIAEIPEAGIHTGFNMTLDAAENLCEALKNAISSIKAIASNSN